MGTALRRGWSFEWPRRRDSGCDDRNLEVQPAHWFGIDSTFLLAFKKRIKGLLMRIFPGLSGLVTLHQPVIDSPTGE